MKSRKTLKLTIMMSMLLVITALFFSACTSIKPAGDNEAMSVIEKINSGSTVELTKMSSDSFLLDSEILHGPTLTGSLWEGLAASGFKIEQAVILDNRMPNASDKQFFGKSAEVDTFFTKYIRPDSMLFQIGFDTGEMVLILSPSPEGEILISAFGGPF